MEAARAMLYDDAGLEALKRSQLIELCKQHSIKVKGKNTELIAKLKEHGQTLLASHGKRHSNDPIDALPPSPNKKSPLRGVELPKQERAEEAADVFAFGQSQASAFDFTFACADEHEAPRLTANEQVIAELNARVAASSLLTGPARPPLTATISSTLATKRPFEDAHKRVFHKMDSITNHYAAKRPHLDRSQTQPPVPNKRQRLASSTLTNRTATSTTSTARSIVGSSKDVVSNLRGEGWMASGKSNEGRRAVDKARAARKKSMATRSPRKPVTAPNALRSTLQKLKKPSAGPSAPATTTTGSFAKPTLSSLARASPVKHSRPTARAK